MTLPDFMWKLSTSPKRQQQSRITNKYHQFVHETQKENKREKWKPAVISYKHEKLECVGKKCVDIECRLR